MTAGDYKLPLGCEIPLPLVAHHHRRSATSTWPTRPCTELPNPEATVLPALVSVFDSEVTSLEPFPAQFRAGMCCLPASHTFLTHRARFPSYETRSSGYQPPHGSSQFGTVSSESYWQALSYVFDCAFRG